MLPEKEEHFAVRQLNPNPNELVSGSEVRPQPPHCDKNSYIFDHLLSSVGGHNKIQQWTRQMFLFQLISLCSAEAVRLKHKQFRVQALACVFPTAQPKGWTLNFLTFAVTAYKRERTLAARLHRLSMDVRRQRNKRARDNHRSHELQSRRSCRSRVSRFVRRD